MSSIRRPGVIAVPQVSNEKLAPQFKQPYEGRERPVPREPFCAATYAAIVATCSEGCLYKHAGCFAQFGFMKRFTRPLDEQVTELGLSALDVMRNEAEAIDAMFPNGVPQDGARGGRDLRIHVGGDVSCTKGARILAAAAERWIARGGGNVWTFTHRWREVPVDAWGPISVFASCETPGSALKARMRGYRVALTMESFHGAEKRFDVNLALSVIPCPAETRGKSCVECRLCPSANLPSFAAIGFELHGDGQGLGLARSAWRGANATIQRTRRRLPVFPAAAE
jgi:hypothetical protein